MPNLLYTKNSIIGRLKKYFYLYFSTFSSGTAENLFLFALVNKFWTRKQKNYSHFQVYNTYLQSLSNGVRHP